MLYVEKNYAKAVIKSKQRIKHQQYLIKQKNNKRTRARHYCESFMVA